MATGGEGLAGQAKALMSNVLQMVGGAEAANSAPNSASSAEGAAGGGDRVWVGLLSGIVFGLLLAYLLPSLDVWREYFLKLWLKISGVFRNKRRDKVDKAMKAFEASIDQINTMQEGGESLGMLVAQGQQLKIKHVNSCFRAMMKWPDDGIPYSHVHTILPDYLRKPHSNWVDNAVRKGKLPTSLRQPLRSVEVLRGDGSIMRCNLSVGVLTKSIEMTSPQCLFYALFSEVPASDGPESEASEGETGDNWQAVAEHLYGNNVASTVAKGDLPPPELYSEATVLCLDVVDFTKQCMAMSPSEVAAWMSGVYTTIEELLHKYSVRKIETRGDCYIVCAGTQFCATDSPDNQVSRVVDFASELKTQLDGVGTRIRVGIACGPVTVAFIGTHQFAPTMCVIGDIADMAANMEHTGRAGMIHLTDYSARRYCYEKSLKVDGIGEFVAVKGKTQSRAADLLSTAWFICPTVAINVACQNGDRKLGGCLCLSSRRAGFLIATP